MQTPRHQYDTIPTPYLHNRRSPLSLIELENVRLALLPFISSARILDLACGSGFYTYNFLSWGATSVIGVDISSGMIDLAQASLLPGVSFIQDDCSIPKAYDSSLFDVVFAGWLLNYAPDRKALVDMFRTVAMNLKDGGRFISVTAPPLSNPLDFFQEVPTTKSRRVFTGLGYSTISHIKDVQDGYLLRIQSDTPVGELSYTTFHLRKELYEEAAREAGLKGELEWCVPEIPKNGLKGEEGSEDASLAELKSYDMVLNFGLLVIVK